MPQRRNFVSDRWGWDRIKTKTSSSSAEDGTT